MRHATCDMRRWPVRRSWGMAALLALTTAGCIGGAGAKAPPAVAEGGVGSAPPLIDQDSSSHDFGAVISLSGRKLIHRYPLSNASSHEVRIVDLVNRKPCCGELHLGKTTLAPGETTELEVKLSIRQEFGVVTHEAVLLTEPPQAEEVVFRTIARAYPPIRFEEITPMAGLTLTTSEPQRAVEFRVSAYGSSTQPLLDLDRAALRSTTPVRWLGPSVLGESVDGLSVRSRRIEASLESRGRPGRRNAEIVLSDEGGQYRFSEIVNWKVADPLSVAPKLVVVRPGVRDYKVLIQARDQKTFRILRVECETPGVHGAPEHDTPAQKQGLLIQVGVALVKARRRGVLVVHTDHPAQSRVDLPFVAIE